LFEKILQMKDFYTEIMNRRVVAELSPGNSGPLKILIVA
jgi:hypothetical protein